MKILRINGRHKEVTTGEDAMLIDGHNLTSSYWNRWVGWCDVKYFIANDNRLEDV